MDIGVEISLYPLNDDYIPPIQGFIERLNADGRFKVITNHMSTQVFGTLRRSHGCADARAEAHVRARRQVHLRHEGSRAARLA